MLPAIDRTIKSYSKLYLKPGNQAEMDEISIALSFHSVIFQPLNGRGKIINKENMFLRAVDMCWLWHNQEAMEAARHKDKQGPSGPLLGKDNRKWYD